MASRLTKRDHRVIADALNFVVVGENPFCDDPDSKEDWITDEELRRVLSKVEERE